MKFLNLSFSLLIACLVGFSGVFAQDKQPVPSPPAVKENPDVILGKSKLEEAEKTL